MIKGLNISYALYTLLCAVYVNFKSLTRHAYAKILFLNGTQQLYITMLATIHFLQK